MDGKTAYHSVVAYRASSRVPQSLPSHAAAAAAAERASPFSSAARADPPPVRKGVFAGVRR